MDFEKVIATIDPTPTPSGERSAAIMFIQDVVGRVKGNAWKTDRESKKDVEIMLGVVVKIAMNLALNHSDEAAKLLLAVRKKVNDA